MLHSYWRSRFFLKLDYISGYGGRWCGLIKDYYNITFYDFFKYLDFFIEDLVLVSYNFFLDLRFFLILFALFALYFQESAVFKLLVHLYVVFVLGLKNFFFEFYNPEFSKDYKLLGVDRRGRVVKNGMVVSFFRLMFGHLLVSDFQKCIFFFKRNSKSGLDANFILVVEEILCLCYFKKSSRKHVFALLKKKYKIK